MSLELPSAEALLDGMEFVAASERLAAQTELVRALGDIHVLLKGGELDNARERYERLKHACGVCMLPDSLEALVLAGSPLPGPG